MSAFTTLPSLVVPESQASRILRSSSPYLALFAIYLTCALIVDPRGEFPLNDDWSYSRSAFKLGTAGQWQTDEWSAPNLVGQALYGGLLVRIFGAKFIVLRLSTVVLSYLAVCLLWAAFRRSNAGAVLSWIAVLAWIFNPLWFCLSFSYMTEVPFLFFVLLSLFLYLVHLQNGKLWPLAACGGAAGYAYLIRQTSILFMAPIFAVLVLSFLRKKTPLCFLRMALWTTAAGMFMAGFWLWSQQHGGSTPAAQRKFELLSKITATQILGNSFGILFYLAFFCLPILICLMPALLQLCREAGGRVWVNAGILALVAGGGLWWFHARYGSFAYLPSRSYHAQMPFLLNILYDTGLGPLTLDPTYYGRPPIPTYPNIWLSLTFLTAAGVVALGLLLTLAAPRYRLAASGTSQPALFLIAASSLVLTVAFEVIFSHLQEGGLFDRHILTAALPLLFLVVLSDQSPRHLNQDSESPQPAAVGTAGSLRLWLAPAVLALAALAWFSVASTHDYLAWNRARWGLGNELLAAGVNPLHVSGGFEFNAWHNYDTFRERGNIGKVYYWWYDRLDFLITMEPQDAYHVIGKKEYFSWVHRRSLPVYLLGKDQGE